MHLETVIQRSDRHFLVSTCYTLDCGWETMVFESDAEGNPTNWDDIACCRYRTELEAAIGHEQMATEFKYVPEQRQYLN